MAIIVDVNHEGGDLLEYDTTVVDGGVLSATEAAALAATGYGLQCEIEDGVTVAIFGQLTISAPASVIRLRFYIDPNTMTIGADDSFAVLWVGCSAAPTKVLVVFLGHDGASFEIRTGALDDGEGWHSTDPHDITDAEHYVEVYLVRAADAGSSDGTLDLWIDGAHKEQEVGIDNFDAFTVVDKMRLGAVTYIDVGTEGVFYLDELKANDDGSEIGPRVAAPIMMDTYRRRRV